MVLSKQPDAKEAHTEEPADNTMGALEQVQQVAGATDDR